MPKQSPFPTANEKDLKGVARTNYDSPRPTPSQLQRKEKYTRKVKELGLPTLAHLPVVEDEAVIRARSGVEIAKRCIATSLCAVKGESNDQRLIDQLVTTWSAETYFSPKEREFIRNPHPSKQNLVDYAWRYECCHVFLWALGHLEQLQPPGKICDVGAEAALIKKIGPASFVDDAKMRPLSELLDMADFYYRLHWAAIDLRLKGKKSDTANEEIIQERHRALNWLIRYLNQEWDDVTTDT